MPIFNGNNNFQGSQQADLIRGLNGGDRLLGEAGDIVAGRSDDSLLGNSTRPPFGGPDDNLGVIIIIGITGASQVQESATGQFSIEGEGQSLGTNQDFSQPMPFDAGCNLIGSSFDPPTLGVGESNFIF
jgi:hypothetical protein